MHGHDGSVTGSYGAVADNQAEPPKRAVSAARSRKCVTRSLINRCRRFKDVLLRYHWSLLMKHSDGHKI